MATWTKRVGAPDFLIAGNFKMNDVAGSRTEYMQKVTTAAASAQENVETVLCPPVIGLDSYLARANGDVAIGAQDCHVAEKGAYTGSISAGMLKEAGAKYVIVGHSERRQQYGETDEVVNAKARAAIAAGLIPIICVGESESVREKGDHEANKTIVEQINKSVPHGVNPDQVVIAYEPVWAIGTGKTPTTEQIKETHLAIKQALRQKSATMVANPPMVLYGGSLNEKNASEILSLDNVNGGLVGGASLDADKFTQIINAASQIARQRGGA